MPYTISYVYLLNRNDTEFMKKINDPKKHHYVPQFYLRKFHCVDDENKVPTISRHDPYLIKKKSSISRIGYEDYLYKISDKNIEQCIEKNLNLAIETPISQSETWKKIDNGTPELLNESDKLVIYMFMRHLESRNIETLEFLKSEQIRVLNTEFREEYSDDERRMHEQISSTSHGVNKFFMGMSNNLDQYVEEYKRASISIFGSNIPVRTSTAPVINVPIHTFQNTEFNLKETTKWLPLCPKFGAMLFLNDSYCDFGRFHVVEDEVIRTLNRLYLVQLCNSRTVRHMIAKDEFIFDDFKWSGIQIDTLNPRKFKYPN